MFLVHLLLIGQADPIWSGIGGWSIGGMLRSGCDL